MSWSAWLVSKSYNRVDLLLLCIIWWYFVYILVISWWYFGLTNPYFQVSFGSAISSMWALHKVHEERQKQGLMPGNECPACFTVMIINIMMCCQFMISSVSLGVAWGAPGDVVLVHYLEFLQFPLSNCALSAFNPVIILVRSGGMKKLKLFKRKLTVSTIISSRNTWPRTNKQEHEHLINI